MPPIVSAPRSSVISWPGRSNWSPVDTASTRSADPAPPSRLSLAVPPRMVSAPSPPTIVTVPVNAGATAGGEERALGLCEGVGAVADHLGVVEPKAPARRPDLVDEQVVIGSPGAPVDRVVSGAAGHRRVGIAL